MAAGPAAAGLLLTWAAPLQRCCLQFAVALWLQQWLGLRMAAPELAGWLAWEVVLSWLTAIFAGPSQCKAADLSSPVHSCPELAAWTTDCCLRELAKKETEALILLNQKSRK